MKKNLHPKHISIREFNPQDYPAIKQNMQEGDVFHEDIDNEKMVLEKIRRNPDSILVAEIDGKVVGNIFIVEDGWTPLLFRLAVGKKSRNKGVGTKPLEYAAKILKKKGYPLVLFLVDEKNKKLLHFYKNRGYTIGNPFRWVFKSLS